MARTSKTAALDAAKDHLNNPAEEGAIEGTGQDTDSNAGVHEAEHNAAIERLLKIAEDAEFESGTLLGDIRDTMLQLFKDRPKPWSQMSNSEQRDVGRNLDAVAKELLRKVVLICAEEDAPTIHATVKGYAAKDDFKITLTAPLDRDNALRLFEMDGQQVVLVRADARRFYGQRGDAENMPDQPDLGFADQPAQDGDKSVRDQAREDFAADSAAAIPLTEEELEAAKATPNSAFD